MRQSGLSAIRHPLLSYVMNRKLDLSSSSTPRHHAMARMSGGCMKELHESGRFTPSSAIAADRCFGSLDRAVLHRVLVIEDEPDIGRLVELHLRDLHTAVIRCVTGREGLHKALNEEWSLVVLDLSLPDLDGLEICRQLRARNTYVPILMLTARSSEQERVFGLDNGADDYLPKPFSIVEFVARTRAILRRVRALSDIGGSERLLRVRDLELDLERREARRGEQRLALTGREFDLLVFLVQHAGKVYSRGQLLTHVWGMTCDAYEHTVSSHINRLRAKLEPDPSKPRYLITVWGAGYCFATE
jgi:DNA-binding response OmpR family regulator